MVLEFGLLNSGLFPASDAEGEGLNPGTVTQILNDMGSVCVIRTGSYTGDGSEAHTITGLGFRPKFVWVCKKIDVDMTEKNGHYRFDVDTLNNCTQWVSTGAHRTRKNTITDFTDDGFIVDDIGVNADPNQNGTVYMFLALGVTG